MRIWIDKEGNRIPLNKMTDSHITNCIRMLSRIKKVKEHYNFISSVFSDSMEEHGVTDIPYYPSYIEKGWIIAFKKELTKRKCLK